MLISLLKVVGILHLMPASAIAVVVPNSARVSLSARQTGESESTNNETVNLIHYLKDLNYTLNKYDYPPLPTVPEIDHESKQASDLSRRNAMNNANFGGPPPWESQPGTVALGNEIERTKGLLYGPSEIPGSMPAIPTLFDTGADRYTVPGWSCQTCIGPIRYGEDGIDLGVIDKQSRSGSDFVEGRFFQEDVKFGGSVVKNTPVFSASWQNAMVSTQGQTVAIMGMRINAPFPNGFPTPVQWLAAHRDMRALEFSFYFGRSEDLTLQQSELTLGVRDADHYTGQPISLPLIQIIPQLEGKPWAVNVDSVKFEGRALGATAGYAMVDTASPFIGIPDGTLATMMSGIANSGSAVIDDVVAAKSNRVWFYPCSSEVKLTFRMGGHDFEVDPRDIIGPKMKVENMPSITARWPPGLQNRLQNGRGVCWSRLVGLPHDEARPAGYILGLPFLRSYYTTFDMSGRMSIKFAKSKSIFDLDNDTVETS